MEHITAGYLERPGLAATNPEAPERPEGVGTAASGTGKRKGEQFEMLNLAGMKQEGEVENSRKVLFPPKQAEKKSYHKSNWFARCLGWCCGGKGATGYKQVK